MRLSNFPSRRHAALAISVIFSSAIGACGDPGVPPAAPRDAGAVGAETGAPDAGGFSTPSDGPPADSAEFATWLAGGAYLAWNCQPEPHPARSPSPHGMNRICQNSIADDAFATTGSYPPGAAWVKEQYDGTSAVFAIEISRRESSATGAGAWRFWRGQGAGYAAVTQDALAQPFCSGCHTGGDRDFVFSGFAPATTP